MINRRGVIALRPASLEDRRVIYEWLAKSDLTGSMCGPPTFPEKPVPTWDEFLSDYLERYFDDSAPLLGRCFLIEVDGTPVGQVNYNDIEMRNGVKRVELDIWLRSKENCGKGYGPAALHAVSRFLTEQYDVKEFMVQPSARNPAAIRAYEKSGFKKLSDSERKSWGPFDYHDSILMVRRVVDRES